MTQQNNAVHEAIGRWVEKGLVSADLATTLRRETQEVSEAGTARLGQYVLAATGAVVLLIATGVFLDWAWPNMSDPARTGVIGLIGFAVHALGMWIEGRQRWLPASYLMQTAGVVLFLVAFIYSEQAWADLSAGGVVIGIAALITPILLAPRTFSRNTIMPAVHLCAGLAFLAVFLDRATSLSAENAVWVLDAVLVVAALILVRMLQHDPEGHSYPWALNAFVAAMYAGFVFIVLTGTLPLDLQENVVWPLDAWLLLVIGLTLWGIHRAPPGMQRDWFEDQLSYAIVAWIPLGIYTVDNVMNGPSEIALLLVGGAGVAGFVYAQRFGVRRVLATSALAFIAAIWYWAVDRGGALGAVFALALTAGLLFWVSGKTGWGRGRAGA